MRAAVIFAHNMDESGDALFINQFTSLANSFGKPILLYDIRSKGSEAYLNLAKEIISHERKAESAG